MHALLWTAYNAQRHHACTTPRASTAPLPAYLVGRAADDSPSRALFKLCNPEAEPIVADFSYVSYA